MRDWPLLWLLATVLCAGALYALVAVYFLGWRL
jgi:hypothetical protein